MKFITVFSFLFLTSFSTPNFDIVLPSADRTVVYKCKNGAIHIVKEKDPSPCEANQIDVKIVINSILSPEISRKIDKMSYAQLQKIEVQIEANLKNVDKNTTPFSANTARKAKVKTINSANKIQEVNFSKQKIDQKQFLSIDNCGCGDGVVASCPTSVTCETCCKKVEAVKKSLEDIFK